MNTYVRAVGAAALQGLLTGVWVAAGELPPAKRRLSRAGAVVTLSAVASIRDWAFTDDPRDRQPSPRRSPDPAISSPPATSPPPAASSPPAVPAPSAALGSADAPLPISKKSLIVTGAGIALSVGTMIGGRKLEKRWLAALHRDGHPHPHRALAVRMGLLSFAATLPRRLIRVRESR
ncbi:hypothetical protein AB0J80_03000 [Actinoplanes sp. NPDC049548]|uniref:hypothetical protein n=1 Tax=Actinoplanes sp. NPDC049548 TaxID=3155152 RepID=UPI00344326D5